MGKLERFTWARNALAHDHPDIDLRKNSSTKGEVILVHGRGFFQGKELQEEYLRDALTLKKIEAIAINFRELGNIIFDLWSEISLKAKPSLEIYRKRVCALPDHLEERGGKSNPSPNKPAPQTPPRSSLA